ncbi:unannotated protein [freshwater metagenome]|uniref:Unannotated protein n=1 Tax=freshwater metagenome TaxID=449393 RepID=A0A6J7N681_9ZZZZ
MLVSVFVEDDELDTAIAAIAGGATTGKAGDGFVAVSEVTATYRISTGAVEPTTP